MLRGLLHDCEIFANLHLASVLSSSEQSDPVSEPGSGDIMVDGGPNQQLPALETFEEPKQMKPKNRGFCGRRVRGSRVKESRGQKKKKYNWRSSMNQFVLNYLSIYLSIANCYLLSTFVWCFTIPFPVIHNSLQWMVCLTKVPKLRI